MRCLPTFERLLFIFGLLMLAIFWKARTYTAVSQDLSDDFKNQQGETNEP